MADSVILLEAADLCKQLARLFVREEQEGEEEMFNLKLFFLF